MTQAEALAIMKTGANVFLTGEPGSGKTHTVNQYVAYLRSCGMEPSITASTGIAATHIGGLTIHSWSGIGVRHTLTAYDLDKVAQNKNVVKRVTHAHVLILDEVSMLSARMFSMVDAVCKEIRRNQLPFGGLQVILVGDFFQLPPVNRRSRDAQGSFESTVPREEFAFRSPAWEALTPLTCYLSEQHRQEDAVFLEFLTAIRRATIDESHMILLRTRYAPKPTGDTTQLYSHNADVDEINIAELSKISDAEKVFQMESRGPENLVAALKRGCLSPEVLVLKVGARVMFTRNDLSHRYVNGTLGVVASFSEDGVPVVRTNAGTYVRAEPEEWHIEDSGRVLARISQVPLRLAWAMTVHKSQGMSLDAAHMDLSGAFEYGQGYVALSRVRTLAGLSLAGLNKRALEVHPEIFAKDVEFRAHSSAAQKWFANMDARELEDMHEKFVNACGGKRGAGRVKTAKKTESTYEITRTLVEKRLSIAEMAKERGLTRGTITCHLEELAKSGAIHPAEDLAHIACDEKDFSEIKKALIVVRKDDGLMSLSAARSLLKGKFDFEEIRLVRLLMKGD